jgi:hypothetical protein
MQARKRAPNARREQPSSEPVSRKPAIPDDLKHDIAFAVRTFRLITGAGTCLARAIAGKRLLRELGLDARLIPGSMLYRGGPHPVRDVVAYCHVGRLDDRLYGHVWNELERIHHGWKPLTSDSGRRDRQRHLNRGSQIPVIVNAP